VQHVPDPVKLIMETFDVRIVIRGTENTKSLSGVNPARMVLRSQAQAELMKISMQRSASGELRWVVTIFPTNAYAQDVAQRRQVTTFLQETSGERVPQRVRRHVLL